MYSIATIAFTHLAILYVLFVPGALIVFVTIRFVREAKDLIDGYDLIIVIAFLFSIAINGIVGLLLTNLGIGYDHYFLVIGVINLLLVAVLLKTRNSGFRINCLRLWI